MKINNSILLFLFLSMIFVACSKEDDEKNIPVVEGKEIPELSLKENSIVLKVGNQEVIDVLQGGGEYKAFTLNKEVAMVELMDGKLTVSGRNNGKTDLIISDGNDQYRKLAVTVYTYDEIKLNVPQVDISFNLGSLPPPVNVLVLQGNGLYSATSDNEDIVTVAVQGETIKVSATGKKGSANVTITDFMGFTATIPVQVSVSINPFTQRDLDNIMKSTTLRFTLSNGETITNLRQTYLTYFNSSEGNTHTFGYEFIDSVYDEELGESVDKAVLLFNLSFEGDRAVGVKQKGIFSYKSQEYSDVFVDLSTNVEIIKNEKGKVWGIFYFVNGESLFYGHFCQNAVPK